MDFDRVFKVLNNRDNSFIFIGVDEDKENILFGKTVESIDEEVLEVLGSKLLNLASINKYDINKIVIPFLRGIIKGLVRDKSIIKKILGISYDKSIKHN